MIKTAPPLRTLGVVGAASAVIYGWQFTLSWPLWALYDQPHLDYAYLGRYTNASQVHYLGAFLALFLLQLAAYRALREWAPALPDPTRASDTWPTSWTLLSLIVGGQITFGLCMVAIYPVAALDVYDYLMYARITTVYGGNPFIQPPAAFSDPLVAYSPWPNEPSVYGPLWQMIGLLPAYLAGSGLLAGLVAFKLTALLFFALCSLVIWRILTMLRSRLAPAGTLLFAWNPLLQFELPGNAHNDAAMVLLLLLATWALVAGRVIFVLPLATAAVLVKLLAAVLGPWFALGVVIAHRTTTRESTRFPISGLMKKSAESLGVGAAISLLLVALAYAPFWQGVQTLHFLNRGNWFTASLPTMLRELLRQWLSFEDAGRAAATLTAAILALFVVWRLRSVLVNPTRADSPTAHPDAWILAAHDITFFYLACACIWWEPWYLTWLVAFAALVDSRLIHQRALIFCYGGVVNYTVFKYIWPVYQPMTYAQIMGLSVLLIYGPTFLHLAWHALRTGRADHSPESSAASATSS